MKHWTADQARSDAEVPEDVVAAIELLQAKFAERGDETRLVSVGKHEEAGDDWWRYEALTELAPGVLLPAEIGLAELIDEWGEDEPDEYDVADEVLEGVNACTGERLAVLADALHEARIRARTILAGWHAEGAPARLYDVRLAPYDQWRCEALPVLQVLVETLDERLEPVLETIVAENLEAMDAGMDEARSGLVTRMARRAELAAKGASGRIDRLALNALSTTGDTAAQLRRFGSEWRLWLPDETVLLMRDGHVIAGSGGVNSDIEWCGDRIVISSSFSDRARLDRAIGRPASELLPHPYLSDDIIVRAARSVVDEGRLSVVIEIDMPVLLFCSVSGRVWEDVALSKATSATLGTATVVPFERRV